MITGWWFQFFLFSIMYGIVPSHWLSYFSRWLLHHQPDKVEKLLVEKWTFFELTPVCWNPEEYGSKSDSNIWKNKPQDHQQSINNLHFYTVVHNSTGNVWYGLVSWNMGFWDADDVSLKFWLLIYRKQWKISRDVNGRFSLKMAIFHVFWGGNITTWFGSYPGFLQLSAN